MSHEENPHKWFASNRDGNQVIHCSRKVGTTTHNDQMYAQVSHVHPNSKKTPVYDVECSHQMNCDPTNLGSVIYTDGRPSYEVTTSDSTTTIRRRD